MQASYSWLIVLNAYPGVMAVVEMILMIIVMVVKVLVLIRQ